MAGRTITVDRLQVRRSSTPGYRPGDNGSRPLADGEMFVNFADGIYQIGELDKLQNDLFPYPLLPAVDDVLGLPDALSAKANSADLTSTWLGALFKSWFNTLPVYSGTGPAPVPAGQPFNNGGRLEFAQ